MSDARRCTVCDETLPSELGCTATLVQLAGSDYPVLAHEGEVPCVECGAPVGGNHHSECPLERCPRCGDHLVDCGCAGRVGKTETKERIEWTIDEDAIAALNDEDACSAIDVLIEPLAQKLEAIARTAGAAGLDPGQLRYQIARTILVEMIRRLALERAMTESTSSAKSD